MIILTGLDRPTLGSTILQPHTYMLMTLSNYIKFNRLGKWLHKINLGRDNLGLDKESKKNQNKGFRILSKNRTRNNKAKFQLSFHDFSGFRITLQWKINTFIKKTFYKKINFNLTWQEWTLICNKMNLL